MLCTPKPRIGPSCLLENIFADPTPPPFSRLVSELWMYLRFLVPSPPSWSPRSCSTGDGALPSGQEARFRHPRRERHLLLHGQLLHGGGGGAELADHPPGDDFVMWLVPSLFNHVCFLATATRVRPGRGFKD